MRGLAGRRRPSRLISCSSIARGSTAARETRPNSTTSSLCTTAILVLPWSPEQGTGGISFYEVNDACNPKRIGYGYSTEMRETHTAAISNIAGGHWEVVDMIRVGDFMGGMGQKTTTGARAGGVQIWDISDVKNPKAVSTLDVPGHDYPDAYKRVVLAEWWQGKYIYAGGGLNGVFVVDASNPLKPTLAHQISITPPMPVFGVMAIGNLLAIASSRAVARGADGYQ